MKFTLIAGGLAALVSAIPVAEPIERATKCTSGIVNPGGPCSYNVTCGTLGTHFNNAKPLSAPKETSLNSCLIACTNYESNDENCEAVNYNTTSTVCQLYSGAFNGHTKNAVLDSAVVYGCG